MQACARIGAPHRSCSAAFRHKASATHHGAGAVMVITADEQCAAASSFRSRPSSTRPRAGRLRIGEELIVYRRTGAPPLGGIADRWLHESRRASRQPANPMGRCRPPAVTAVSCGRRQSQGRTAFDGWLPGAAALTTQWTFDFKAEDVFWCTADIGWVTGHTYIAYGPLALGATEVVFEGVPTYPDAGRFWKMIQNHKVSVFYTAPTAIRSLIKAAEANEAVHPRAMTSAACASWVRWANRSIRPPGSGTTSTSAAAVAPSSTRSGRPKPVAT